MRTFIYKKAKNCETFYIQKAIHLTLWDSHEIVEVGIIFKKHDTLRDTSQKSRQFAIRFYIQNSGTFALRNFSLNF